MHIITLTVQVYESTENEEKLYEYSHILQAWNILKVEFGRARSAPMV